MANTHGFLYVKCQGCGWEGPEHEFDVEDDRQRAVDAAEKDGRNHIGGENFDCHSYQVQERAPDAPSEDAASSEAS